MPHFTESIPDIFTALGRQSASARPPAELGSFESVAAAFLTRAADERITSQIIKALRDSGLMAPTQLAEADPVEVEDLFRTSGARSLVKLVRPLLKLARWFAATLDDDDDVVLSVPTESLRDGLRSVNGIGPATADAVLLEGFGRAAYPVDRATYRILVRHGWIDLGVEYDEVRSLIEGALGDDPATLAWLSAEFATLGRLTCRATVAKCDRCPLRSLLPESGPLGDS